MVLGDGYAEAVDELFQFHPPLVSLPRWGLTPVRIPC
jgi:hypothetical protein